MEYGTAIWHAQIRKDLHSTEMVQRRVTKLLPHLKNASYEERLHKLKLPSLTYRRARGDMINTWKYISGGYNIDEGSLFTRTTTEAT